MLSVRKVAKYMISYTNEISSPVSNLKLQKLLYFAWIEFYKKNGEYLFGENFYAWQFGPVVPEVYYEYCVYGGLPIIEYGQKNNDDMEEITTIEKDFIKEVVNKYKNTSAAQMVRMSHESGRAWDFVYHGVGSDHRISFTDIIRFDVCNQ